MPNLERLHQPAALVRFDRQSRAIVRRADNQLIGERARAAHSATVMQNTANLGDGLMTALDQLRRHEARAASEDPVVADEYARIRRLVADLGMNEIIRYGQRPVLP